MKPTMIIATACLVLSFQSSAEPIDPADVRVVDGDTVQVYGVQPNVRLVGFDAPEVLHPDCDAERVLGVKSRQRRGRSTAACRSPARSCTIVCRFCSAGTSIRRI
jgi:endonuclease YncB( thermonuclease family)